MDKVYVGFISTTFGLKGEVKIISDLNHLDKIFKIGNTLLIDDKEYVINKSRLQKNNYIVLFEDIDSIEQALMLIKKEIYIDRKDIKLANNEYLISDFINLTIFDHKKKIGIVENILYNKQNFFIKCGKLIIPINEKYFDYIDFDQKNVYVKNTKELEL